MRLLTVGAIAALWGCASVVPLEASHVRVTSLENTHDCSALGTVSAEAFYVKGGEGAAYESVNNILMNSADLKGADTVVITKEKEIFNGGGDLIGHRLYGRAFACGDVSSS